MNTVIASLLKSLRYIRLKPFETSDAQGRTDERYRRATLTVFSNVLSKALAMAVMVFSIAWTVSYLGAERLGAWMTISSLSFVLSFLGLGIGSALTNRVAFVASKNEKSELKAVVTGGLGFMFFVALLIGTLAFAVVTYTPWNMALNTGNIALSIESKDAARVFAVLFSIVIFNSALNGIFAGLQKSYIANLASAVGSGGALAALYWVTKYEADLPQLLFATLGIQALSGLMLLVALYRSRLVRIKNLIGHALAQAPILWRQGGLFFLLQIGGMIAVGGDALIVSSILGAEQVALLGVTQRFFQFASQPLSILNTPLWGAYADADARGDRSFVLKTLKWSMLTTLILAVISVSLLSMLSGQLLAYWTFGQVKVPHILILWCGIWAILECLGGSLAMFLNGTHIVREQVIVVLCFSLTLLPLKIYGVKEFGLIAIPVTTVIVYLITHTAAYGYFFWPKLREKLAVQIGS